MKLLSFTLANDLKVAIIADKIVAVRKAIPAEVEHGTVIDTLDGKRHIVTDSVKTVLDVLLAQQSRPPPSNNDEGY